MSTATTANKKESDKFKDLCGPTDPKLDCEIREKLITARVGLLFAGDRAPIVHHLHNHRKKSLPKTSSAPLFLSAMTGPSLC